MIDSRRIVVVASNISEQRGGEAIKALQFIRHLVGKQVPVSVITHERSEKEVREGFPMVDVHVVPDTALQRMMWAWRLSREMADSVFFVAIRPIIKKIAARDPDAVFHYMVPVSPIVPRFPVKGVVNVLGPLTGNIHYPPAFRDVEPARHAVRRRLHHVTQTLFGLLFGDKRHFDRVLVSGGDRTQRSLNWAGCPDSRIVHVIDSGISDKFLSKQLIRHSGDNLAFMTSGRLVHHKGVWLTIEALRHTKLPIRFDIYGDGEERDQMIALAAQFGVSDRVRFMGWMESHDALIDRMANYRGYMVPSLAEANGIVVQEAMMAGLPAVCLKWGGPAMLADDQSGILIDPVSHEHVVLELAKAMDRLAADPDWANHLAANARRIAERRFPWPQVGQEWRANYPSGKQLTSDTAPESALPAAR